MDDNEGHRLSERMGAAIEAAQVANRDFSADPTASEWDRLNHFLNDVVKAVQECSDYDKRSRPLSTSAFLRRWTLAIKAGFVASVLGFAIVCVWKIAELVR